MPSRHVSKTLLIELTKFFLKAREKKASFPIEEIAEKMQRKLRTTPENIYMATSKYHYVYMQIALHPLL